MGIENILQKYDISINGFLPAESTPVSIRVPYCRWHNIVINLPTLICDNTLDETVDNLEFIEVDSYTTLTEHKMIYSMLSLIMSAYIWCNGEENPKNFVPKQISVPLSQSAKHIGIPPILTHAAIDLFNWKVPNTNISLSLDNLDSAYTITGTKTESWFCLEMVAIEYNGRNIPRNILEIIDAYKKNKTEIIIERLRLIAVSLDEFNKVLDRMYEKCDPDTFYNVLRKYLGGWNDEKKFPKGMHLECVGEGIKYIGGSAAQSSMIQVLDVFFGIKHKNDYLTQIRKYMPSAHRDFLSYIENDTPNLLVIVQQHRDIVPIYISCVEKLSSFRSRHMGLIYSYIYEPAKKNEKEKGIIKEIKGTGGTELKLGEKDNSLKCMLKQFREETDNIISIIKCYAKY